MRFIDEAKIYIKSGNGGNGCASFRREANVPKGGPDGGNGGKGGDVIFKAISSKNTLVDFYYRKHHKADNGEGGKGKNRFGKAGKDVILEVPVGTQILTDTKKVIADLDNAGDQIILLEGGKGGAGNTAFKNSRNQSPKTAQKGEQGKELNIELQLKIISDVGVIGFPNAGKSTLLSSISHAKPKIANYPFTTLKPKLGVVFVDDKDFVIADIPGLIKGASEGVGLGYRFLKHIERCKALIHLIDVSSKDLYQDYQIIRKELQNYSSILTTKKELLILNKIDLIDEEELSKKIIDLQKKTNNNNILAISSLAKRNLEQMKREVLKML